ncbi:hypothetical protein ACJ6WD_35395 [Streptomyces sp. VTCC 41912]|uniref:hypothetical protein n=1 Tax=Streptomyces sp. VTCC 41912 TaxID=3383243 RepID=UPI003896C2E5
MTKDYAKQRELQQAAEALLRDRYNEGHDIHDPAEAMKAVRAAVYGHGAGRSRERRPEVPVEDVLAALTQVGDARQRLERLELDLIRAARSRGASWQRVADGLGLGTRQSAETRAMRLETAARSAGQDHDVAGARIARARQRIADEWCVEHEDRIRMTGEQLYDAAAAWPDLDTVHIHQLATALAAGSGGPQLMECLQNLRATFAPHDGPRLQPTLGKRAEGREVTANQADAAVAARDAMLALLDELRTVRSAVLSAKEAR